MTTTMNNSTAVATEQGNSVHQEMFTSLLRTPHRQVDETLDLHVRQFDRDPNFYGHLATWAAHHGNNVVRDINEVFLAVLFASEYPEHREAAYVMLQSMPPYQVARVMRYVTGYDEVVRHVSTSKKSMPVNGKFGVTVSPLRYGKKHPEAGKAVPRKTVKLNKVRAREMVGKGLLPHGVREYHVDSFFVKHACLNKRTVKGMLRRAIRSYLRFREKPENIGMLEGALIRARDDMFGLYFRTNTAPGGSNDSWINQYLFKHKIDENSPTAKRLAALARLRKETDPVEQAKLIVEHKLPWPQVVSVITKITPTVMVAQVEVMSPQELLQNLASLKARGAFDNPDLKKMIMDKMAKIKKQKGRVDALKGAAAAKAVDLPADVAAAAVEVTDAQLKFHGTIRATTALLIDKSGSMQTAIELGKQLAAGIAQSCSEGNEPKVFLFDNMPTEVKWRASDGNITKKSAWDQKLKMFRASGGTEPHNVLRAMISQGIAVEQIMLVTDEGENACGSFASQLKQYEKKFGFMPNISIARVKGWGVSDAMTKSMKAVGIDVEAVDCTKADQVSIPNLLQLLSRKSIFELVQEIGTVPLPTRDEWDTANGMK